MGHADPPQLFAGFFGAIGLYNALVFTITRDKPFAWYGGIMASMLGVQMLFDPFLVPAAASDPVASVARVVTVGAYFVCMVGFVRSFLHLREDLPHIDAALQLLLAVNLAGLISESVLPRSGLHEAIDDALLFALLGVALYAGIASAGLGRDEARYYTAAFAGALAGVAINDVAEDVHAGGAWLYAFSAGVAWEALFLALALASRVRFASVDQLTGIRNRRAFDDGLTLAWREGMRARSPVSVIMIDVNGFKEYNDTLGHPAGDALLRRIALLCASCCRGRGDLFARYGGDEFAAVLPGATREQAEVVARRMQAVIGESCPVTISVGIASASEGAASAHDLVQRADGALYTEKRSRSKR